MTFAQYLEKWLKQFTTQGLNNPLVKMPVKRFRLLTAEELKSIADGGMLTIGTIADPIARNLYKNSVTRIRERGEHCVFVCFGSVEMAIAGGPGQQQKTALFPICLKRARLQSNTTQIKVIVTDEEPWQFNPVLQAHLKGFGIEFPQNPSPDPTESVNWLDAQLSNRSSQTTRNSYVGLFSSQHMVLQARLEDPIIRRALAQNPVIQAKIAGTRVQAVDLGEITDDGMENLGLVLPCDDSQLRVVQLSGRGHCLQVEGPPGTGKSQTIANIISNALYQGRNALLVCDKKAAITQVEERLSKCGLQPTLLNLHDEALDKREFLRQATSKFPKDANAQFYPFEELNEIRKTLNERVKFGRSIIHPSVQVTKRDALAGMIQLRKELKNIPSIGIANWQALSKDRLTKVLRGIGEWPGLKSVLTDTSNVWNRVKMESFDENPNAANEVRLLGERILLELESVETPKEWIAAVGVESTIDSDATVTYLLKLSNTVTEKPSCHNKLIGNTEITISELEYLKSEWDKRENLIKKRHPVALTERHSPRAEREAKDLLASEGVNSWQDLLDKSKQYTNHQEVIEASHARYRHLCTQIGLVYSPLAAIRRAQLQAISSLAALGMSIPQIWWDLSSTPVLAVANWQAQLQTCSTEVKNAPLPMHLVALERIADTHWKHVEAKAEHGFNLVSYCFNFVNDRKCKYALRQAFPTIPSRRFSNWQEVTLHAVSAWHSVVCLRSTSGIHVVLKQLTSAYLAQAHEHPNTQDYVSREEVKKLEQAAALTEQMRMQNDLFDVEGVNWRTFWESINLNLLSQVRKILAELDTLQLPPNINDNIEAALEFYRASALRIQVFLKTFQTQDGDCSQDVLDAFDAQKEYATCESHLQALDRYIALQPGIRNSPDWNLLRELITWRDSFENLCGAQKLDVDSPLWNKLRRYLANHKETMERSYLDLEGYFEHCTTALTNYCDLSNLVSEMLNNLPNHPLWLEKKRWHKKISAFPEIESLWNKVIDGTVKPEQADQLFCFNLLRICDPVAKPNGPEFRQVLKSFTDQDEKLATWVIDCLRARLRKTMQDASGRAAESEATLQHLAGLQRIKGTVRELANANLDYLLSAKRCWMASPTSLANFFDSNIFEKHGIAFDLVIFDEASQLRVLDGMLSMSFGKQVIIVGDKNQLPPTDFFGGFANPDSDLDQDFGISESMLDEFTGAFQDEVTKVMLMSHYRSETPDLIRFSNDWFYGAKLEMYPPARVTGVGRRLHYVPEAIYSETTGARNNIAEAKAVVKLVEQHVREWPEKSLGVVTMNIPQMELIDEQIAAFTSGQVRSFCADESRFFLRNLETVQGDEMDRIILSLTYGRNSAGVFNASILGPLTRSGGERRLNVAITRARTGLTIVSSLKAADLEFSNAQSRGFQCLKSFLLDLENAEQARTFGIENKRFDKREDGISNVVHCESPFEEQVVQFLENEGYELECQYGAGKFRIDIVVKEHGRNLLAIECDGAAYHSSLVARTRDRARQRLLERLGWRIHRVWSTNWWYFEQQEKESIIAAINSARSSQQLRQHAGR